MASGTTQRVHEVHSPLPDSAPEIPAFILRSMRGQDGISRPFRYDVELLSTDDEVDPKRLLGERMVIQINIADGRKRFFNGMVSHFSFHGIERGYAQYRAVLRPWIWFLMHTTDCRIFQEMDVPQIFEKVVNETHGFTDYRLDLSESYKTREYCVQYRESDFNFVSRLLEEEGIFYFFEHEESKHTMVLGDAYSAYGKVEGDSEWQSRIPYRAPGEAAVELEHISQWDVQHQVRPAIVVLDDYDFTKSRAELEKRANSEPREHAQDDYEVYDYPGLYYEPGDGDALANVRIEELQSKHKRLTAQSDHRDIASGKLFELEEYPRASENGEYVILSTSIALESAEIEQFSSDAENRFDVKFVALPSREPFHPPRRIPKPKVYGPQTAMVVGPDGEEIWTDEYGRVKLQFHWDREGESDENSSCWIRVSQLWAGKNWGGIHIPRIGQEVLVDFLEGDPDRPVITGRVYNDQQMPPYDLPDNQTQSGIKSRSTKEGTPETFNELRFEDKIGEEEIYFHAEKNFNRVVENDDTLKVGFEDMDPGDQSIEIYNNQSLIVGDSSAPDGSQSIEVWKNRTAEIKTGNDETTVAQGNHSLAVSAGQSTVEAAQKITLKVGSSKIMIEPTKITLQALQIIVQGNAKVSASAPMTEVSGSATLSLSGGIVKIN